MTIFGSFYYATFALHHAFFMRIFGNPGKETQWRMEIDLRTEISLVETEVKLKMSMVASREKNFLAIIIRDSTITPFASEWNMKLWKLTNWMFAAIVLFKHSVSKFLLSPADTGDTVVENTETGVGKLHAA